jgi:hypothetical protein
VAANPPVVDVPRPSGIVNDTAIGEGLVSAPDVKPMLRVIIDRLLSEQNGPFASGPNALALSHCEEALRQLKKLQP